MKAAALLVAVLVGGAAHANPLYQRQVLPNGLEVVIVPRHTVPLVTIEIAAHSGAETEPPEWNGLSHLYEHMFFKANSKLPDQAAFMRRVRTLGIEFNGATNDDRVSYFFTTTTDHFDGALALMHDAITSPAFDETELARERVVVTGELDRDESKPEWHLRHAVSERLWWKYPSRKQPMGRRETILSATPAMMRAIGGRYFVPNNAVLVVAGDVDEATTFAAVARAFADWPRADDPFVRYPLVHHPPLSHSSVVVVTKPVSTVTVDVAWQGPSSGPDVVDETTTMSLFETLANQPSSPLQKALVRADVCLRARVSWDNARNVGPIHLELAAAPAQLDTCLIMAAGVIRLVRAPRYFQTSQITEALAIIEEQLIIQREQASELAHALTHWWAAAGLDSYDRFWTGVQKVTPTDLTNLANTYWSRPFVVGVLAAPELHVDPAHVAAIFGITP